MSQFRFGHASSIVAIATLVVATAFVASEGSNNVDEQQEIVEDAKEVEETVGEQADPVPELSILVATTVNVSDDDVAAKDTPQDANESTRANAQVVLTAKNGDIPCDGFTLQLVDLQHQAFAIPAEDGKPAIECTDGEVSAGEAERLELYFPFAGDNLSRSGSVVVQYGSGPAVAKDVDYRFQPRDRYFIGPLIFAALLFAVLVVVLSVLVYRRDDDQLRGDLVSVKGWTFANSWASNVSLVGGISATLLSTTAVFERLRFISAEQFAALNLILTGVVLTSPLLIGMTARRVKGRDEDVVRIWGFLLSASLSTAAIAGQVAGVLGPIWEANLADEGKYVLGLIVLFAVGVVVAHGVMLFWSRLAAPRPGAAAQVTWQEFADAVFDGRDFSAIERNDDRQSAIIAELASRVR